jgi:FAD/FMN-containing dehydrogenase
MKISGWGNYPFIESEVISTNQISTLQELIRRKNSIIPSGLLRSYGDSGLNAITLSSLKLNRILSYDYINQTITCESGISFQNLNNFLIPKGFFVPVTPGTKFITLGGAIASDVHGKNHHKVGTFGNFVQSIRLILASGEIINCSNDSNQDIFRATIGGMGLTGFILDATFRVEKINSTNFSVTTKKANSLEEMFELFNEYSNYDYSVAWMDTSEFGKSMGRGVLILGKELADNSLEMLQNPKLSVPFIFPNLTLNHYSIKVFNTLYNAISFKKNDFKANFDKFYYPLDILSNWNKIYGNSGFVQFQFVVPREYSFKTIRDTMNIMKSYSQSSFLTVLKFFGKSNDFYLSFPKEGFTLAMDFPIRKNTFEMLNKIDDIILSNNGKLYLTKDARMSKDFFEATYSNLNKFREIKSIIDPNNKFSSLQSKRLGI